ncbi:MAG: hypothetical protein NVS3B27_09640 [Novosphingobium sp.]
MNTNGAAEGRPRRSRAFAALVAALVLVIALGVAVLTLRMGYWHLDLPFAKRAEIAAPEAGASGTNPLAEQAELAARTSAGLAQDNERIAALEQRIDVLSRAADAAAGNATHAESIMVAAAARRAVERGEPLGYLANQLRLRFAVAQPDAVERVIAAAARPVTLSYLSAELERLAPTLKGAPAESGWSWVRRETSDLFTIRRNDRLAPDPEARLQRARLYLVNGRVDMAVGEVNQLPGRAAARTWLGQARDYQIATRALDMIEASAVISASPLARATQPAGPPPRVTTAPQPSAAPAPAPAPAPAASGTSY